MYEGDGFCIILVKGEVICGYYYSIAELVNWMNRELGEYGIRTETFLSAYNAPLLAGEEKIDDRTFVERRTKEPVVQSIFPEIYQELSGDADEMIHFISTRCRNITLQEGDKHLLHDFFCRGSIQL